MRVDEMESIDMIRVNYVKSMLAKNMRGDNRGMYDFRKISVTPGTMGNAEGSAQVDLGLTKVLAGVKIELEEPMKDTPDQGNMTVAAELLPLASPAYETGPPSAEAVELSRVVDRGIRAGSCIDLKSLFIEPEKAWGVYIDVYVLNYGGNLFDACELAAMSALINSTMPILEDDKVVRDDRKNKLKIDNIVTSATFAKIDGKMLLDPSLDEEIACDARLTVATDGESIRAMQKGLRGGFYVNEIEELVGVAFNKHEELKALIQRRE
jgi:exosome complex component RRP42